jgi:hypothetical protein
MAKEEVWQIVEARRDDGAPTIFRIRELDARTDQPRIFVAELPYPVADELSRLPDASSYRRFATFEEQWLDPACNALGWTPVAVKIEDGSFFVYVYGAGDPMQLVERLSPFDGALGFFDEADPEWAEYASLKALLDEAKHHDEDTKTSLKPAPSRTTKKKPAKKKPAKKPAKKSAKKPAKKPAKKSPAKKSRR